MLRRTILILILAVLLSSCVIGEPKSKAQIAAENMDRYDGRVEEGPASWYGGKFHGRPTASGEIYDMDDMTAAHKKLPFGTRVEVTNLDNGKSVEVTINDRGPYKRGRLIDLSKGAAKRIGMLVAGTARVSLKVLR